MTGWDLPSTATIGGAEYKLTTDFRDILGIMRYLNDPDTPEFLRWQIAIALFYEEDIPPEHQAEAMEYLAAFISCGETDTKPGPVLLDWDQDVLTIVADVNKIAGTEIRGLRHLHWWTFLSYFRAIGEGQLSTLVTVRDKLRRGKKLEKWEQEYYRSNQKRVDLKKKYSAEELAEQERLQKLLNS